MRSRFVLALAPLLATAPGHAQTVTRLDAVSDLHAVDATTQTQDIRFRKDAGDRMTVPVRVSGSGPFRFMIDTGADRTVVSREIVQRLGLRAGPGASLHSVTGVNQVGTALVDRLDLSTKRMNGINAAVLEAEHMGADGILGTDSLQSQRVQFDFGKNLLSITPSRMARRDEPGTIVVKARRRAGRLIVTQAYANGRPITVVVDTGSDVSIGNAAMRAMLEHKHMLRERGTIELMSVTGAKLNGEYTMLRELELGGIKLSELAVVFADAHTFRQMNLNDRPALLLGMNAIRSFNKVSIDFANKKLRVLLPASSEKLITSQLAER